MRGCKVTEVVGEVGLRVRSRVLRASPSEAASPMWGRWGVLGRVLAGRLVAGWREVEGEDVGWEEEVVVEGGRGSGWAMDGEGGGGEEPPGGGGGGRAGGGSTQAGGGGGPSRVSTGTWFQRGQPGMGRR